MNNENTDRNSDERQTMTENAPHENGRRAFLGSVAVAGLGVAALGLMPQAAKAALSPNQPEAESGHDYPMAKPHAKTEKQFRVGVMGPAMLSLKASQIAVDKASNADARQFANFELREATGVVRVLDELGTPKEPMKAGAIAFLRELQALPKGKKFDQTYIAAELANHEYLRDLAATYIANSAHYSSVAEKHGRHLAMVASAFFKEHIVLCKNIAQEL